MDIIVKNARLAFPALFTPEQYQGQGPHNYRATFLVEPNSEQFNQINKAIEQVAQEKWGAKAKANLTAILANPQKTCFVDGNLKGYNGYENMWALSAVRNADSGAPAVVDRDKSPIGQTDGKIYSGCYVNGKVSIWTQDNAYGKAIRATLIAVQFVKDGESFGGATPANAEGFDEIAFEDDDLV